MQEKQPELCLGVPVDAPQMGHHAQALCELHIATELHQQSHKHLLCALLHIVGNILYRHVQNSVRR